MRLIYIVDFRAACRVEQNRVELRPQQIDGPTTATAAAAAAATKGARSTYMHCRANTSLSSAHTMLG